MSDSVSFDRAASFYDATRALTPEAMAAVQALLRSELQGRGRCLEIGVGTGRMALPLALFATNRSIVTNKSAVKANRKSWSGVKRMPAPNGRAIWIAREK